MIIFSWTLTPNQVLALRSVADFHRRYKESAAKHQALDESENRLVGYGIQNWCAATRHLFREGFISHKEVPLEPWEKKKFPSRKVRQSWEITTKGLLVLQLVEIEVNQQANVLQFDRKQLKLLQAVNE